MKFESYRSRLASSSWRKFAHQCIKRAGGMCCMCGCKSTLQVHHMRYDKLGTRHEWKDVAVVCDRCHDAYHKRVPVMPEWPAKRIELLSHLAATLMREGIEIDTFHAHGDQLNDHWLSKPIVEEGLIEDSKSKGSALRRKSGYSDDNRKRGARNYWRLNSR